MYRFATVCENKRFKPGLARFSLGDADHRQGGQAELFDLEDGLTLRVGDAGSWGEEYRQRLAAHREAIKEACRKAGWTLTLHRTDRPASEGVLRVASLVAASRGASAVSTWSRSTWASTMRAGRTST